jgi:hypothetical protein
MKVVSARSALAAGLCGVVAGTAGGSPSIAGARAVPGSPLDGRWAFTWTRAELHRHNSVQRPARYLVEIGNGHISRLRPLPVRVCRITTNGTIAIFVCEPPLVPGVVAGRRYQMRWSIYRDRLTWSTVPGRAGWSDFALTPWTRVR